MKIKKKETGIVIIGSDHGGYKYKENLIKIIKEMNKEKNNKKIINVIDVGTFSEKKCDYPDIVKKMANKLLKIIPQKKTDKQENFGVLICKTGIGMCMAANRKEYIRAAVCNNIKAAKMSRKHNNANVLCIGSKATKIENIKKIFSTFIFTEYENCERHNNRINKF